MPLTIENKISFGIKVDNDDVIALASEYETMSVPNYEYALELYLHAANNGSAEAKYHVGRMYKWGDGVEKSATEAIKWFEDAAKGGYAEAQDELDKLSNFVETDLSESEYFIPIKPLHVGAHQSVEHVPKCPTCGSPIIEKLKTSGKVGSAVLFGVFALGHISKTFKCGNCGNKW
jgi:predicted RNA-binding Zn-ribbon protein involved in translation (DUF1610 family)